MCPVNLPASKGGLKRKAAPGVSIVGVPFWGGQPRSGVDLGKPTVCSFIFVML